MKSIITNYLDVSCISGKPTECIHHAITGSYGRDFADKYGLLMPLTNEEHNLSGDSIHLSRYGESLSKMIGQLAWEKEYYKKALKNMIDLIEDDPARSAFRKELGISYL